MTYTVHEKAKQNDAVDGFCLKLQYISSKGN